MAFQHQKEFLKILAEVESENIKLKDQLLQFFINWYYCYYYMGWNNPTVNKEKALRYLYEMEQSFQDIDFKDDWEKYFCEGWYNYSKAWYEWVIKDNVSNATNFQEKCVDAWSKVPEEGDYYSAHGYIMLGWYYFMIGDFEKGEKYQHLALSAFKKYNNLYQYFPLGNLVLINRIKGNFQKAKELNLQHLNLGRQNLDTNVIFDSLTMKGSLLFQEGNYDEAFEAIKRVYCIENSIMTQSSSSLDIMAFLDFIMVDLK
ncbi:MAG: hypothetical protein GPJ54_13995 [Candidatus Heimdallarchaeota archaeon]|nr:hypothetical protein [Candidatus Heimdallarchaeota archaeon]